MRNRSILVTGVTLALAAVATAQNPPVRNESEFLFSGDGGHLFSEVCDLQGDTLVTGAARDDAAAMDAGSLYTFDRVAGTWVPRPKLFAFDAAAGDLFGHSVLLQGTRLVVGAARADGVVANTGAAYVYTRSGTSWALEAKLAASDGTANDLFGSALAMDGDTLVVGASGDDANGGLSGSAYVFVRSGTSWTQQAKLVASNASPLDRYGDAVGVSGDRAVVGSPHGDGPAAQSGSVYVYVRSGTTWTEETQLLTAPPVIFFGRQVAIFGDTIVATELDEGFVFERSGTSWSEVDRLAPDTSVEFGHPLDFDGETLVVGDVFGASFGGSLHTFRRGGSVWAEEARLEAIFSHQTFPVSVAVSGDVVVAGTRAYEKFEESSGFLLVFEPLQTESFCDATDGSLASCPCANPGGPESGCDLAQATGGVELNVVDQDTAGTAATLVATGFPPTSNPAAVVIRSDGLDASSPVVFGDGLRCVGTPTVRLGAAVAVAGTSTHTFGHGAMAGPGTFFYQLWFRNTPGSYCDPAAAFNLSNGRTLSWP